MPGIVLDPDELDWRAARASGPGGQHVNRTSTAVELRFDIARSATLRPDVKARLARLAGSRMTQEGVLILFAQSHRSQEMNRRDALDRLIDLVRQAGERPKPRKATRATLGSKIRRMDAKGRRCAVKAMRTRPPTE